jgi:ubiquinone/menaquinone biosynthesis C-methylase UbiE
VTVAAETAPASPVGLPPADLDQLTRRWIAALQGVERKLIRGAAMAGVGCGAGATVITLALAYPRSRFLGVDDRAEAIAQAHSLAGPAGVSDRVRFEVAGAEYPGTGYDLVAHLAGLPAEGDPTAAARHVRKSLAPDGTWAIVAPVEEEGRLRAIATAAGFTRFRRPLSWVLEARP